MPWLPTWSSMSLLIWILSWFPRLPVSLSSQCSIRIQVLVSDSALRISKQKIPFWTFFQAFLEGFEQGHDTICHYLRVVLASLWRDKRLAVERER